MQFPDDTALAAAIANPDRVLDGLLEFDWNRNGLYDHPYSNLSWLLTSAIVDTATITSDLPRQLNTVTGFSSGELQVQLGGNRFGADVPAEVAHLLNVEWNDTLATQGMPADQLFSPYYAGSPLAGITVPGTPVRYWRVEKTATSDVTVRQFTGEVRDFEISQKDHRVNLTATDIADVEASSVTLPRWAIVTPRYASQAVGIEYSPGLQGLMSWVIEEALRQAGRPTGPATRADAKAYLSCNGTLLPSIGSFTTRNAYLGYNHALTYDGSPRWILGKYGYAPALNPSGAQGSQPTNRLSMVDFNVSEALALPQNGSSDAPMAVGCGHWMLSNGSGTGYGVNPANVWHLFMDDNDDVASSNPNDGRVTFITYPNGTAQVFVYEASTMSGQKIWQWNFTIPLSAGWHYLCPIVRANPSSLGCSLWLDGVEIFPTSSTVPSGGFRYQQFVTGGRKNRCLVYINIPSQHYQIFSGGNSVTTYTPGQENPPTRDGMPLSQVFHPYTELHWMPDVYQKNGWDLLKTIAESEFGAVHTNEFGQVIYASHPAIRLVTNEQVAAAITISDDKMQDFIANPTNDQYANTISLSSTIRTQILDLVWRNEDPLQFFALPGEEHAETFSLTDVIGILGYFTAASATPTTGGASIYDSTASVVRGNDLSIQGPTTGWGWGATVADDGRSMDLLWWATGSAFSIYVGSYIGGNQTSMGIAGRKYSKPNVLRQTFSNPSEVAARGERVVTLPDNEWRQGQFSIQAIANDMLIDTVNPAPVVKQIPIPADPRLQLRDVVKLTSEGSITGALYAQIIGIRREDSASGSVDTLTLRVVGSPGAAVWDDPDLGWDVGKWAP